MITIGRILKKLQGIFRPVKKQTAGLDIKSYRTGAAQRPQPALEPVAAESAGFIGMSGELRLNVVRDVLMRPLQGLGQLRLAMVQTAQAHRDAKDLVDHDQRLAFVGIEQTGQNCRHARAEIALLESVRQRLIHQRNCLL